MLDIVTGYHCMQFQRKYMIQTQENSKKPHFGPDLGQLGPNSDCQNLFSKNLTLSVTRYHGQLSSYKISEKTTDQLLGKFSDGKKDRLIDGKKDRLIDGGETWMDGQTGRQTDGQADGSDFTGHFATDV